MDDWKTSFLLGRPIFRCYVSFREGTISAGKSSSTLEIFLPLHQQVPDVMPVESSFEIEIVASIFQGNPSGALPKATPTPKNKALLRD